MIMEQFSLANRVAGRNYAADGLLRGLYRDLEATMIPFELAIATGERHKAIALQEHIDFVCSAMLVIYEKQVLLRLDRLKS